MSNKNVISSQISIKIFENLDARKLDPLNIAYCRQHEN